jgi:hypothetical protein
MTVINHIVGRLFDALFGPLRGLPPLASLALVSLLVSVLVLWVYRATSNQRRMADAKRRMQAGLYEMRLFNDEPRFVLKAFGNILVHNMTYVRLSLVPLLWMIVPITLMIAQLQSFYGYRAFQPGETFLLQLELAKPSETGSSPSKRVASSRPDVELRLPAGLHAETPAVWLPPVSQVTWRVRADRPGRYAAEVRLAGETFTKDVRVGDRLTRLSPRRFQAGFFDQLLYPAEDPISATQAVESLDVTYPSRDIAVLGLHLPWLVVFFVLSFLFALLLKGRFRVTF